MSLLNAGRVGRPHGLDGSFHVTRPVAELIAAAETVDLDGRTVRIERRAGTADRPILRLEGSTRREDAEALRGATLRVDEALAPAAEDEYWPHELAGCTVHDGAREVGVVRRMIALPSCEALEVEQTGGGELLVPLVRDAIRAIDREGKRIDVDMEFLDA
jgi:16S rRNA processing protein RimM